jgi:hypothetical protein
VAFRILIWCLLAIGTALPVLLALRGVRLAVAVLAGALSPLLLGVTFLLSLLGSWGSERYGDGEFSRTAATAIASILSSGAWAAGTALAVLIAMLRDRREGPARIGPERRRREG